jgi:hypothetical protein
MLPNVVAFIFGLIGGAGMIWCTQHRTEPSRQNFNVVGAVGALSGIGLGVFLSTSVRWLPGADPWGIVLAAMAGFAIAGYGLMLRAK